MIKLFNAADMSYTTNGDVVIQPTKARVYNSDNGDYYLELNCGTEYSDYIKPNNIIVAPTPQGEQAFRIRTVTKTKKKIEAKAWHVFYDSQNYVIADSYAVNMTCNEALNHFNAATDTPSPYTMLSNITSINTYRCVRSSLAECINTIIERWGGHLVRDNWKIKILAAIGVDNGVTIEYKKNLQELTAEYDFSNVVTKLLPVGKNGILLEELYVYSALQYDVPYTKVVTFNQDYINEDDYKDADGNINQEAYNEALEADLQTQAQNYVNTYCLPLINYSLKGNPEKVTDIGDIINVKDERLGVNITTEVISYEYDAIQERYVNLEFGNFTNTLSDLISNINASTNNSIENAVVTLTSTLDAALQEAQDKIWNALGSSYVIYDGDKILILDRLPKEDAENVIKLSNSGFSISKSGINGTYNPFYSIDGVFMLGGTNDKNSILRAFNENNEEILTIDKNGLKIANKSVYEALYYATNDTETLNGAYTTGFVTDNAQKITFTIQLSKSAEDITNITADSLKLNIIKTDNSFVLDSGYIVGGYNVLTDATITTNIKKINDKTLTVELTKQGGFNADNNAPLFVNIDALTLSFN